MSVEDYLRNFAKRPPALAEIQRAAKAKRLDQLSLREINLEIKRYRRGSSSLTTSGSASLTTSGSVPQKRPGRTMRASLTTRARRRSRD